MLALLLIVALAGAAPVFAGGAPEEVDVEPPEDEREEFVVGFQVFRGGELGARNRLLVRTVPRLLREQLAVLPEHELSAAERTAIAQALIDETMRESGAALDEAVEDRAGGTFDTGREDERRRELEEADAAVEEARAELAAARRLSPADVEVAAMKPISLGADDADPVAPDRLAPRVVREEDLDLLVTGSLEELDGTLIAEVSAYHRFLEREVYRDRFAVEPGNTDELVSRMRDGLAEVLLGRPWGRLAVSTSPEEAAIYVDDRLIGFGEATVEYARIGSREIRVSRDGVEERRRVVEVRPSETTAVDMPLLVADGADVRIESRPAGADVYRGSVWQGVTPLALPRPGTPQTVILSEEGFLDETVVLSPEAPGEIVRELVPDPGNWPEIVQERRDRFYRAFGWFALSIPVPVMLNGMYQDIAALYPGGQPSSELSDAEAQRLAGTANTLLWSARGATVVSAGLFVNMTVHLIQYIRAGQYAHD